MNWLRSIAEATTLDALLALVNEYILTRPEASWSWVPRELRPRLVSSIADLHHWHQKLAAEIGAATNPNIYLQDLGVFFVRASMRAHELEQHERKGRLANDGSFEASGNGDA